MNASVALSQTSMLVLDAVGAGQNHPPGVLLTLEGRTHGQVLNCALIPLGRVRDVIAMLELVAAQVKS